MSQCLPIDSTCAILACTPAEFLSMYNDDNLSTDSLHSDALGIIEWSRERLRAADQRYRLDTLLSAMLTHAPHESGKRWIAVALHIAHNKGGNVIVDVAKACMDYLFLPMLTVINTVGIEHSGNWTPSRLDPGFLSGKVAIREQYRCPITAGVDKTLLWECGLRAPAGRHSLMAVVHIIPVALANFVDKPTELTDVAHMWNMFICWTGLDINKLSETDLNSPENAVFLKFTECCSFGQLQIYFDKEAYPDVPNKYAVRMAADMIELSDGRISADVELSMRDGIRPPSPEYLAVHSAFARVASDCGAAQYVWAIEDLHGSAGLDATLSQHRPMDFASKLMSRLSIWAH